MGKRKAVLIQRVLPCAKGGRGADSTYLTPVNESAFFAAMDPRRQRSRCRLQAALKEELIHQSLSDVSIDGLARKSGVTRQTFYAIYDSTSDMLDEYLCDTIDKMLNCFKESNISVADIDLEQRADRYIRDVFRSLDRSDARLRSILAGEAALNTEARFADLVDMIIRLDEASDNDVTEAVRLTRAYFWSGAFVGTLRLWVFHPEEPDAEEIAAVFASLVVRGCRPASGAGT